MGCCINNTEHKFEPRYSESIETDTKAISEIIDKICKTRYMPIVNVDKFVILNKKYEHDICVKCGEISPPKVNKLSLKEYLDRIVKEQR